jgi:hypothetical protein
MGAGDFIGIHRDFIGIQRIFLAAAGIAEFKDCERDQEIVKQIVEWSFWLVR